jgi:pilus assembly protein CpaF
VIEEEVIVDIIAKVRALLEETGNATDEYIMNVIEETVFAYSRENYLTATKKHSLIQRVYNSIRGLDILQPLLDDPTITEIMINSHKEIFIEKAGETFQANTKFESEEKLRSVIDKIVSKVNRTVNDASPIVDARLQDGSRVNVVLPPVALKGPTMTIRKFPEKPLSVEDLIAWGSISPEVAIFLQELVVSKFNIFIGGGTGSGKTTFLNVLSNFIPSHERIITIEDSAELQIKTIPNLVTMETKNANTEGKGEITIRDLIKTSLRMRPDRIVVGEVRGAEALDMLQAMNTGHDGSISTGHANSIYDMISRLETMVLSGANLPIQVIRKQISSAIDIMIHLSRLRDHSRKVVEISEIIGIENGEIQLNPLYEFSETGETPDGKIIGGLVSTGNELKNKSKLKMAGFKK